MKRRKAGRGGSVASREPDGLDRLGEFGFIARMARPFIRELPAGVEGIGDDCAVMPWTKGERLLVTTDMLLENRHFIRNRVSGRDLGWKSLAVNLSDIAAMGGRPKWALLSLGIPEGVGLEWLDAFYKGWREAARPFGVRLVGGDTTRSPGGIVISIVVGGTVRAGKEKLRSGAAAGDVVAVTGAVGDSGGGLKVLLAGGPEGRDEERLVRAHHRPRPHVEEGEWLAGRPGVRAMMDVSDGIDSDIRRIMERSRVGADIALDRLPVSAVLRRVARKRGFEAVETAATGGEDYCLLVTVAPETFERTAGAFKRRFGRLLAAVGTIRTKASGLRYFLNGRPAHIRARGYDHFKSFRDS
ncbi:MAG TPA: thiamine-phosphate kinase [Candidatus Aminicenantes bacterium]|nr:thiamine-phosphate kinase [Candidatus Aminicenantes bacterium]